MSQDTTLLHVYGWRRDAGPFFLGNPSSVEDGISLAEGILKDCRRGFLRAVVKDVRAGAILAPVLRPGGVKGKVRSRPARYSLVAADRFKQPY